MTIYRLYRRWCRSKDAAVYLALLVAIGLLIATGVIGPSLDRYDAERAAVAQR